MRVVQTERASSRLTFCWPRLAVAASCRQLAAQAPRPRDAEAAEREPPRRVAIRFLTDSDFPPFNYFDEDNVLTGFNVDVARAICLELSAACDIQVRPWAELLPALAKGEADAVIASHSVRPNALKVVDFTDRYYFTPARFAGKRGTATPRRSRPRAWRARRSPSPRAPRTRPICAPSSATARSASSRRWSWRATRSSSAPSISCSTTASAWPSGSTARPRGPAASSRAGRSREPKYFGDGIGIAVKREDAQLKTLINRRCKRMRESGRYEELLLRYFPLRVF